MRKAKLIGLGWVGLLLIIGFVVYRVVGDSPTAPPTGQKVVLLAPPPGNVQAASSGTQANRTTPARASIELKPLVPVPGAKPPVHPPPPPPPLPKPPSGWYLQVAAYYGMASAKPLVQKMRQAGFETWLSPTVYHERRFIRIWIGPYKTRRSAYPHMARITALAGASPFWVEVGGSHAH
ncbi:MAG: SPOR domain-containing protein [Gammaproteobacteria bacterium]